MGAIMSMQEAMNPTISVILPVYNGAKDVPRAIASILAQTYRDFELIVIDDGSLRDDTWAVLTDIKNQTGDPRLRIERLEKNIGLAGALNHGISLARGRYIARQDHDDISKPERFAEQVRFLDANPKCGLLGTHAEIWVGDTPTTRAHDHALDNGALQFYLLANNPFVHSSVMIRRDVFDAVGVYSCDPMRQPPEDFELWSRIARRFEVANLPEKHVIYRELPTSLSRVSHNPFLEKVVLICAENIAFWNGLPEPDRACHDAAALTHGAYEKLSAQAKISEILAVVQKAAEAISARTQNADIEAQCQIILHHMRNQYMINRIVPRMFRGIIPWARSIPALRWLARWIRRTLA
jgi:glycosyltransferase involved in cell wall biosynthesis